MRFRLSPIKLLTSIALILGFAVLSAEASSAAPAVTFERSNLGTIKGVVRDQSGSPIADATVAIFKLGTSQLLKQVSSASNGSFIARIAPGTYTVLAVAQGFNPVTLPDVEVGKAAQVNYGFRLERAGQGNTLPEKRVDRNSSKWRIRAAQAGRSIYQNAEGDGVAVDEDDDGTAATNEDERRSARPKAVVESFVADTSRGTYAGLNLAAGFELSEDVDLAVAAQLARGAYAPQRFEGAVKFRPSDTHQLRLAGSIGILGHLGDEALGQLSLQATDEWRVREGLVFVYGVDYSKFIGAGSDFSLSPRLGVQFDIDPRTRVRAAFTSPADNRTWTQAIEFEGTELLFPEPTAVDDLAIVNDKPLMNKSRRLEFGIERILDNSSTIEGNIFLDTTLSRGVGLNALPFDTLGGDEFEQFAVNQQGRARGARIVYNRRLSGIFSTAAGYAFGSGQHLSAEAITNPSNAFENAWFHTFFGQLSADLRTGTSVRTVFRFSPDATVFAIDPFKGRLAIYDPGLSILVTQSLPTLGLPFRAQAIVDARNVFGFQQVLNGEEGSIRLAGQGRTLRGGIRVRF
jgi:hypothetical protein